MNGWTTEKFIVRHYRRGDLLDGEAFVLVPERDPTAIVALRAYAQATPDKDLAETLAEWIKQVSGDADEQTNDDRTPSWVASLAADVRSGTMTLETALFRMAGFAANNGSET